MSFSSMALGALTATLAVTSSHAKVFESSAHCTVQASSYTDVGNKQATAQAVKDVSSYMCDGESVTTGDPYVVAESSAYAFAEAVAHASVDCTITGQGSAAVQAHAKAEKKAKVWLSAWAQAISTAEVCGKCSTYASATVSILEKVLLKAVAEVYLSEEETNDDKYGTVVISEEDYDRKLKEATVTAFALALTDAVDDKNGVYCGSLVDVAVSTPKSSAQCWTTTDAFDDSDYISAIVSASLEASASSCSSKGLAELNGETAAHGVARAVAQAFASVLGGCETEGKGFACVANEGWIETIAVATAEATASAWVDAMDCHCEIDTSLFVQSLGGVIAEAATHVYDYQCTGYGGSITQDKFMEDFERFAVKAIAKVFVEAYSSGSGCGGRIVGETSVCQCVNKLKSCHVDGKVLGCCQEGFYCSVRKGAHYSTAKCRQAGTLNNPRNMKLQPTCGAKEKAPEHCTDGCVNKSQSCYKDGQVLGCCHAGFYCSVRKGAHKNTARCRQASTLNNPINMKLEPTCAPKGEEPKKCACVTKLQSCYKDGEVLGCCNAGFYCSKKKGAPNSTATCRQDATLKNPINMKMEPTCKA